ncbi:hypothetical protein PM082_004838 [Marasmius tenuissimus]|nr:hypothetical protein PM082_004838 [Marasmius tenuissimus]
MISTSIATFLVTDPSGQGTVALDIFCFAILSYSETDCYSPKLRIDGKSQVELWHSDMSQKPPTLLRTYCVNFASHRPSKHNFSPPIFWLWHYARELRPRRRLTPPSLALRGSLIPAQPVQYLPSSRTVLATTSPIGSSLGTHLCLRHVSSSATLQLVPLCTILSRCCTPPSLHPPIIDISYLHRSPTVHLRLFAFPLLRPTEFLRFEVKVGQCSIELGTRIQAGAAADLLSLMTRAPVDPERVLCAEFQVKVYVSLLILVLRSRNVESAASQPPDFRIDTTYKND